jgi:hypothetical protein
MFNDFFTWNLSTHRDLDALPALTDADHDELFRLFDDAGLPSTAIPPLMLFDVGYEEPYQREAPKIGRNAPYPCGSGKKFRCCGA